MNNDFEWKHLPFSFLNENNAFMIITVDISDEADPPDSELKSAVYG